MHSLIRFIPSASLLGGGRDIYKKEYYYACVQDVGSRYINSSCLYVESATVLSKAYGCSTEFFSVSQRCASTEGYFRFSSVDFGWSSSYLVSSKNFTHSIKISNRIKKRQIFAFPFGFLCL